MLKASIMMFTLPAMPLLAMAKMGAAGWSSGSCAAGSMLRSMSGSMGGPASRSADCSSSSRSVVRSSIVDTARSAGSFQTLLRALSATDLDVALSGAGPFTVFAPTDDAFQKLPQEVLQSLLDSPEDLAGVLKYHVVPARLTSENLSGVGSLKTLEGGRLDVDTAMGVRIGAANVIKADIQCENGVIHVIDDVLLPGDKAKKA